MQAEVNSPPKTPRIASRKKSEDGSTTASYTIKLSQLNGSEKPSLKIKLKPLDRSEERSSVNSSESRKASRLNDKNGLSVELNRNSSFHKSGLPVGPSSRKKSVRKVLEGSSN